MFDKFVKTYSKTLIIIVSLWMACGLVLWGAYHNQKSLPNNVSNYLFKDFGRNK